MMASQPTSAPGGPDYRPLIVTLWMPARVEAHFQMLRDRHFPRDRNIVPAHVTLFHHLPGMELEAVASRLKALSRGSGKPRVEVTGLRSLGNGVAYRLESASLADMRAELAHAWSTLLIPQDRAPWAPHITVQNKVEPGEARTTMAILASNFAPSAFQAEGLLLWRYLDGPWEKLREFRFAA